MEQISFTKEEEHEKEKELAKIQSLEKMDVNESTNVTKL